MKRWCVHGEDRNFKPTSLCVCECWGALLSEGSMQREGHMDRARERASALGYDGTATRAIRIASGRDRRFSVMDVRVTYCTTRL